MTLPQHLACGTRMAVTAWAAIALATAQPAEEQPVTAPFDVHATPKFEPLPGKAVGVLVAEAHALFEAEGRYGPPDAVGFGRGIGSYRWVYVPARSGAEGEAVTVRVGTSGDATRTFEGMIFASPRTLRPWGITAPYTLVEVEVNGGRGSPAVDTFAATGLRVVEGTDTFRPKVAEKVHEFRGLYDARLKDRETRDAIKAAFDAARKDALKGRKPTGPRRREDQTVVTWMPRSGREPARLRVEFRTRISDGAYRTGQGTVRTPEDDPRSEVPPRGELSPRAQEVLYGTSFGIVLGRVYEVSPDGKTLVDRALPIRTFVREVGPPGGAPPAGAPRAVAPPG